MNSLRLSNLKVARKLPLLDELTSFGQRETAPAIHSLYLGKVKQLARAVASVPSQAAKTMRLSIHSVLQRTQLAM